MTTTTAEPADLSADEIVGNNVHYIIWSRRMVQKAVAADLKISDSTLSKRLRGTSAWSAQDILDISRLLGVSVERLFEKPTAGNVPPKLAIVNGGGMKTITTSPMLNIVPTSN